MNSKTKRIMFMLGLCMGAAIFIYGISKINLKGFEWLIFGAVILLFFYHALKGKI